MSGGPLKIPWGRVARSAGVGFRISNSVQVVGHGPTPLGVTLLSKGYPVFIERGAAPGGTPWKAVRSFRRLLCDGGCSDEHGSA
jgi:hypothetical protein